MVPSIVRFMMFGAIVAFYVYYVGGCLIGRFIPRSLAPETPLEESYQRELVSCYWGEVRPGVKLLFELDAHIGEGESYTDRQWNRSLGTSGHRFGFLHVIHFEGDEPLSFELPTGSLSVAYADREPVTNRSVHEILEAGGDRVTTGARALLRSLVPPDDRVEIAPMNRFRYLVAFPDWASDDARTPPAEEVLVRVGEDEVVLRSRRVERGDLALFVDCPHENLPEGWDIGSWSELASEVRPATSLEGGEPR